MRRWRTTGLTLLFLLSTCARLALGQTELINSNVVIVGHANSCVSSGSVNAYACNLDSPLLTYVTRACYSFQVNLANTGPATLNLNGLGAIPIKKHYNLDLIPNDLKVTQIALVCYDGAVMQMQSQTGNPASGTGTVTSDTATKVAVYPGAGTTVAGSTGATFDLTQRLSAKARVTTRSGSATLSTADGPTVRCDTTAGTVLLTLPAASGTQGDWMIAKVTTDTNPCQVQRGGTDTVNFGTAALALARQGEYIRLDSDGVSNWYAALAVSSVASRSLDFELGAPGGSALTAGNNTTRYMTVPVACTVKSWSLLINAGTITVKFWRTPAGTAIPTSANSLNTNGVGISTGTAIQSTTLTDFTPNPPVLGANDILAMNVFTVATASYVRGSLQCDL